jgi:Polyketide cyclase / dehydrase and lipid transport
MPEIEYSVQIAAPVERVWAYVETIPNWAHLVIGFQKLELVDDRRSIWTLRGNVGILSREVDIQADITRWEPLRRVEFEIAGLSERLSGGGSFTLAPAGDPATAPAPPPRPPWYRRLRLAVAGFVLRRVTSRADRPTAPPEPARSDAGASRLTFHLTITPGGPMAPMLELLMAPMLEPAAQDLGTGIRAALETG